MHNNVIIWNARKNVAILINFKYIGVFNQKIITREALSSELCKENQVISNIILMLYHLMHVAFKNKTIDGTKITSSTTRNNYYPFIPKANNHK